MHWLTRDLPRLRVSVGTAVVCSVAMLTAPAAARAGLSWSGPDAVDPQAAGVALNRLACPATTQCTAVDANGQEVTFNPQSPEDPASAVLSTYALSGVACPSTSQCTAVDLSGQEVTFNPQSPNGGTHSEVDASGIPLGLVCPSAAQCTAVDTGGQAVTFNPESPGTPTSGVIDLGRILIGVACPGGSLTKCAAVDSGGGAVLFDPQAPSAQTPTSVLSNNASAEALACRSNKCVVVDNAGDAVTFGTEGAQPQPQGSGPVDVTNSGATPLSSLSCSSDSECVAVDVHGSAATFNPTLPIAGPVQVDPSQTLSGVACPTDVQCSAVDRNGQEVTFNPQLPGKVTPTPIDGHTNLASLSCFSTAQCTAVDVAGGEVTFSPGSPAAPSRGLIDARASGVYGLACPASAQCTAVDSRGQEITFNPQSPGSPTPVSVDSGHALFAVDCVSATQCTAIDDSGRERTFNPQSPSGSSPVAVDSGHGLSAVACPTATQCTAVDDSGAEVTFNPQSPGRPVPSAIDLSPDSSVTCPSASQCTAVDAAGDEVTFDPGAPSQAFALAIDPGNQMTAVACRTPTDCVALDRVGRALEGDPRGTGAWAAQQISANSLVDVSCRSALECVAIDQPGNVFLGSSGPLPPVPTVISGPSLSGRAEQGRTLTEGHGRWSNAPTSYSYQWQRCDRSGRSCVTIPGANAPSYELQAADVGHRVRVEEWAYNITGAGTPAGSSPTAVVKPLVAVLAERVSLAGVSSGHPRLTMTLAAAVAEPPLKAISISLPGGLTLSRNRGGARQAITVRASHGRLKASLAVKLHSLAISLKKPAATVRISVGAASLNAGKTLVAATRSHKHPTVRLILTVTQPHAPKTRLLLHVKVS